MYTSEDSTNRLPFRALPATEGSARAKRIAPRPTSNCRLRVFFRPQRRHSPCLCCDFTAVLRTLRGSSSSFG